MFQKRHLLEHMMAHTSTYNKIILLSDSMLIFALVCGLYSFCSQSSFSDHGKVRILVCSILAVLYTEELQSGTDFRFVEVTRSQFFCASSCLSVSDFACMHTFYLCWFCLQLVVGWFVEVVNAS